MKEQHSGENTKESVTLASLVKSLGGDNREIFRQWICSKNGLNLKLHTWAHMQIFSTNSWNFYKLIKGFLPCFSYLPWKVKGIKRFEKCYNNGVKSVGKFCTWTNQTVLSCLYSALSQTKEDPEKQKKKKKVELLTIKHQIFFYSTIEGPSKRLNKGTPMTFLR